mgnify:CR=1 FL=1
MIEKMRKALDAAVEAIGGQPREGQIEMAEAVALLQSTTLAGAVTLGVGFTLIEKVVLPPLQDIPPPV